MKFTEEENEMLVKLVKMHRKLSVELENISKEFENAKRLFDKYQVIYEEVIAEENAYKNMLETKYGRKFTTNDFIEILNDLEE